MTPVSPFQGLGHFSNSTPGRRYAAVAAALCPGLACDAPSGRKRVWRDSALVLVTSTVADSGFCAIAFRGPPMGKCTLLVGRCSAPSSRAKGGGDDTIQK